jgi:hypothetical protein
LQNEEGPTIQGVTASTIEVRSYGEYNELAVFIELWQYGVIEFYPFRFWAIFPKIQGGINSINYTRKDKDGKESY